MLSIFACPFCPFSYFLWRNVCLFIQILFSVFKFGIFFSLKYIYLRERERKKCSSHLLIGSPRACTIWHGPGPSWETEMQSVSSKWVAGINYLSHPLLPLTVCISKKLESGSEHALWYVGWASEVASELAGQVLGPELLTF